MSGQAGETGGMGGPFAVSKNPQFINVIVICERIKKEASLTPPGIVDALCEGGLVYVCNKAIFVEELREFARMLRRDHLLLLDSDC
jgi:hypothetical protein